MRFTTCEFPHSDICGSKTAYVSPQHFVVCHVLLRLLVPRHSPYALSILTNASFRFASSLYYFSSPNPIYVINGGRSDAMNTKFLRPKEVKNLCMKLHS